MSETGDMRPRVVRELNKRGLDAYAIEVVFIDGIPDVECRVAWLELKWLRDWTSKTGVIRLKHFTADQKNWLTKRWKSGGACFLLIQVKREWLLIAGKDAMLVGTLTRLELREKAIGVWDKGCDWEKLCALISLSTGQIESL